MRRNDMLGIIFACVKEDNVRELTAHRVVASVPFGGRYRVIDFQLSNMVNSGVNKVGVITKENYQSLMDHTGSGKAWGLSRKREGLYLLPPFGAERSRTDGKIESLASIKRFLANSHEDYVLLADGNWVLNIDYAEVAQAHEKNGADITAVYAFGKAPVGVKNTVFSIDVTGRVRSVMIKEAGKNKCNYSLGMYLISREKLMSLVDNCMSRNLFDFDMDLLQRNVSALRIFGYEYNEPAFEMTSTAAFFQANMASMEQDVREKLFDPDRPIYTKVRDDMPSKYGLGSVVKNSVVADGCIVEGDIEHCVLFRGVKVGKGAVLKDCVIMQDCVIGENTELQYVLADKEVTVSDATRMVGAASYPVFIDKGSKV